MMCLIQAVKSGGGNRRELNCLAPCLIIVPVCLQYIYCHSHPLQMIAIYNDSKEMGPLATLQLLPSILRVSLCD